MSRCARARVVLTPFPLVVPKLVPRALPVDGHPVLGAKDVKAASLARRVYASRCTRAVLPALEGSVFLGLGHRYGRGRLVVLAGGNFGLRCFPVKRRNNYNSVGFWAFLHCRST